MFNDTEEDWSDQQQTREDTQSAGVWLRLKRDGEKALMVFPVPPYAYRQVWNQKEQRSEIYDPDRHDGQKPSGRFAFPVFEPVPGKKEYTAKIFTVSGELYDLIVAVRKKYGSTQLYEVTRKGSGTDTKYQVLPERPLAEKEIKYLRSLEPLDAKALILDGNSADDKPSAPPAADPWKDEEGDE